MTTTDPPLDQRIEDQLDDLKASGPVRRLVRDLSVRQIVTDRRANYLSVRPYPIGAIALYAHAHKVSIAVEPLKAQDLHLPGATLQKRTPGTTYVVLDDADIDASYGTVRDLALGAIDWRAVGPQMTLGHDRNAGYAPERETCPNCWLEITPSGACGGGCE